MKIFLKIFILFQTSIAIGQDINFSQFYELPLLRNPALAGIYEGDYRLTGAIRSQWAKASSPAAPFLSQAASGEMRIGLPKNADSYTSIGLQLVNDLAGDGKFGKFQVLPVIAYNQLINSDYNVYITAAFMGGFVFQHVNYSKLTFDDQFVNGAFNAANPTLQPKKNSELTYFDGTAGLTLSGNITDDINFYIGAAYFHFTEPKVSFFDNESVRLHKKIAANGGLTFPISDYSRMTIYADYFTQGGNSQGQGGLIFKHDLNQDNAEEPVSISIGALLRWNDAVIPVAKLDLRRFGIGFSYDATISKLQGASRNQNAFELTFSFKGFRDKNKSILDRLNCPQFKN